MAQLRRLSAKFKFGAHLDDALRDRLVCGLRSEAMQKRLLSMKDLTFQEALDTAQAMETADKSTKALQGSEPASVNQFTKSRTWSNPVKKHSTEQKQSTAMPCYRCGKSNHASSNCRFIDATCHHCQKGLIASVCRSKKCGLPPRKQAAAGAKTTNYLYKEDTKSSEELHLFSIGLTSSKATPITCEVLIDKKPVTMEVDTGAEVSLISDQICKLHFPNAKLSKTNIVLKTYTQEILPTVGELDVRVEYGAQFYQMRLVVVAGDGPTLLGRQWLRCLKLDWHKICHVAHRNTEGLTPLLQCYQGLFKDEMGNASVHKAKLHVRPDAVPKFFKPRSVPLATKDSINAGLDKLEAEEIVEKVDHSDWAAPIVAVPIVSAVIIRSLSMLI